MKKLNIDLLGLGLASALVLTLCSCSGNSASPSTQPSSQPGAVPSVTVTIPAGASNLGSDAFGKNPLVVAPGTKVVWKNSDTMTHHLVSDDGTSFDTGDIAAGASASWVAVKAGEYAYHCSIHPSMTGVIDVGPVPSPSETPTPVPSADECAGMPDGTPCNGEVCAQSCNGTPQCESRIYYYCSAGRCDGRGILCTNPSPSASAR